MSEISSLLEVWLRLLMSTYVLLDAASRAVWQIIFTASKHGGVLPVRRFLLRIFALFCPRGILSGLLPELPLTCFQHFLNILSSFHGTPPCCAHVFISLIKAPSLVHKDQLLLLGVSFS